MAYHAIGRRLETDPDFPLPDGCDAVIAEAATAMQEAHARRTADAEAYAATRLTAMYANLDAYRAERAS